MSEEPYKLEKCISGTIYVKHNANLFIPLLDLKIRKVILDVYSNVYLSLLMKGENGVKIDVKYTDYYNFNILR